MTTQEAIQRASLRKHRHKTNYEHVHLALAEELQREPVRRYDGPHPITWYFLCLGFLLVWWLA